MLNLYAFRAVNPRTGREVTYVYPARSEDVARTQLLRETPGVQILFVEWVETV